MGFPPPPPLTQGAIALITAPALNPAATASSLPAAINIGRSSFTAASTTAPGSVIRERITSQRFRICPPSCTSQREITTG